MDFISSITGAAPLSVIPSISAGASTSSNANINRRRSLRVSNSLTSAPPAQPKVKAKSKKRTLSVSAMESKQEQQNAKRQRVDDKKADTQVSTAKKDLRDAARKRWLYHHRALFHPLLPRNSAFLENLERSGNDPKSTMVGYTPLHPLDAQPKLIVGGEMKDYQLQGLSFLVWMYNNGMNALLGDEMGLGKTLQTLSLFAHIKENAKGKDDPHLVICPLSVLSSWETETARWLPSFRSVRFHGSATERTRLKDSFRHDAGGFDICLTTYEAYSGDADWFKSRRWCYCVLDEGHKIKNPDTNIAHQVQGITSLYRLLLTGTPVQNNLSELWGLLHWLYAPVFTSTTEHVFKDSFNLEKGAYDMEFVGSAKALLATVMLRRTKSVVELDVPPREELTVFIPLSEAQRFWMMRLLTRMDSGGLGTIFGKPGAAVKIEADIKTEVKMETDDLDDVKLDVMAIADSTVVGSNTPSTVGGEELDQVKNESSAAIKNNPADWKRLMNLLMQLRKVCDHPYLLPNAEPEPYQIGEHLVESSSKLVVIDKLLADILPTGDRVLIFTQWTGMLDLLEDFMALRDIPYARLDGSTRRPRRTLDIKLFQQEKSPYQVFLISTKAGGLGINLTKASHVIMCDSDWNPQNDLQAIARAHRISQRKVVKVYRLICRASVEDQMLDRIRRKLFLSFKVMGSDSQGNSGDTNTSLGYSDLMDILRKGSSALTSSDDDMSLQQFIDAPIAEILDVSRARDNARNARIKHDTQPKTEEGTEGNLADEEARLLREAEKEEMELLSGVAQVKSRLFEGKLVQRNNQEIAREWTELKRRERVDRTVVVNGTVCIQHSILLTTQKPVVKNAPKKPKYEHEDVCVWCRDGGTVNLCAGCPRVYHTSCYESHMDPALSTKKLQYLSRCSQHSCTDCGRPTADVGGMLFRCRTCPQAFCEDCIPNGEIDAVGESIPEFLLLGFDAQSTAYFIKCHDCHEHFAEHPKEWAIWEAEIAIAEKKLQELRESGMQ